jgi:hypothetical protein
MIDQPRGRNSLGGGRKTAHSSDGAAKLAECTPRADLTPREMELLQHLTRGLGAKEIAQAIGRSTETVKRISKAFWSVGSDGSRFQSVPNSSDILIIRMRRVSFAGQLPMRISR